MKNTIITKGTSTQRFGQIGDDLKSNLLKYLKKKMSEDVTMIDYKSDMTGSLDRTRFYSREYSSGIYNKLKGKAYTQENSARTRDVERAIHDQIVQHFIRFWLRICKTRSRTIGSG